MNINHKYNLGELNIMAVNALLAEHKEEFGLVAVKIEKAASEGKMAVSLKIKDKDGKGDYTNPDAFVIMLKHHGGRTSYMGEYKDDGSSNVFDIIEYSWDMIG